MPEYIPRRIGEILRAAGARRRGARRRAVAAVAAPRARSLGALAGVLAVLVFAAFAVAGLPINTRYAFLAGGDPVRVLRRRRVRLDAPAAGDRAPALVDGRRRARARRARRVSRPSQYQKRAPRTGQTRTPAAHRRRPRGARRQPRDHPALRPRGGAQPRARAAARAVSEDEPGATSSAARSARLRAASTSIRRARRSKATTCSTRTTRTSRSACRRASRRRAANRSWLIFRALPGDGAQAERRTRRRLPLARVDAEVDRAPHVETRRRSPVAARGSGPGAPAAPAGDRLRLLPSGPDLVRKPTPRGTRTIDAPRRRSDRSRTPRRGIQPR